MIVAGAAVRVGARVPVAVGGNVAVGRLVAVTNGNGVTEGVGVAVANAPSQPASSMQISEMMLSRTFNMGNSLAANGL